MKVYAQMLLGKKFIEVEIMAIVSKWAMVRWSNCSPVVISVDELINFKKRKSKV